MTLLTGFMPTPRPFPMCCTNSIEQCSLPPTPCIYVSAYKETQSAVGPLAVVTPTHTQDIVSLDLPFATHLVSLEST
jgi:hypothetical protein